MPASDALILLRLLHGQPREGTHAQRLEAFYAPQAAAYDSFRERLLHGRRELIEMLSPSAGERIIELGAGTGRNLLFLGEQLARLEQATLVDLCPALLEQARQRTATMPNVQVIEADVTHWQPQQPADCVYLSYALTMIPDWRATLRNAIAMLRPGGRLGVVDFYVSAAHVPADADADANADSDSDARLVQHGALTRWFWPRWFAHDGVHLNAEHLTLLRQLLPDHRLIEGFARVPYLPGLRVPYYRFVGRTASAGSVSPR
jgi:S-adenosylmethionine-diacylgycerolhomoserine-N-methlytransferase